jgi:hypothetical protein
LLVASKIWNELIFPAVDGMNAFVGYVAAPTVKDIGIAPWVVAS